MSIGALEAAQLHSPTPPDKVRQRQGPGGKSLEYVDARYVMEVLDALGPENWQCDYRMEGAKVACGIGIDIEGYLNLLREGQVEAACDLLVRENPMPAVTGRVCHHPCETGCNRGSFDEGVAIHALQRQLGDLVLDAAPPKAAPAPPTVCTSRPLTVSSLPTVVRKRSSSSTIKILGTARMLIILLFPASGAGGWQRSSPLPLR